MVLFLYACHQALRDSSGNSNDVGIAWQYLSILHLCLEPITEKYSFLKHFNKGTYILHDIFVLYAQVSETKDVINIEVVTDLVEEEDDESNAPIPTADPTSTMKADHSSRTACQSSTQTPAAVKTATEKKRKKPANEEKEINNQIKSVLEKMEIEDEDALFGQYIAGELRSIKNPKTKIQLKMKIQNEIGVTKLNLLTSSEL